MFSRRRAGSLGGRLRPAGPDVRGPVEDDQVNWSEWSPPFAESGQQIELPSPRRFFQLEIALTSHSILDGIGVNSLVVEHIHPAVGPAADRGNLPRWKLPRPLGNKPRVPAGALSTFAYDIRADISETDVGFDALEIFTPSRPQFKEMFAGDPPVATAPDSVVAGEKA